MKRELWICPIDEIDEKVPTFATKFTEAYFDDTYGLICFLKVDKLYKFIDGHFDKEYIWITHNGYNYILGYIMTDEESEKYYHGEKCFKEIRYKDIKKIQSLDQRDYIISDDMLYVFYEDYNKHKIVEFACYDWFKRDMDMRGIDKMHIIFLSEDLRHDICEKIKIYTFDRFILNPNISFMIGYSDNPKNISVQYTGDVLDDFENKLSQMSISKTGCKFLYNFGNADKTGKIVKI